MSKIVLDNVDLGHSLTNRVTLLQHNLSQTGMFDDEQLAGLIDIARMRGPQFYTLGSPDDSGYGNKWQTGVIGDMAGKDVLAAIKEGYL